MSDDRRANVNPWDDDGDESVADYDTADRERVPQPSSRDDDRDATSVTDTDQADDPADAEAGSTDDEDGDDELDDIDLPDEAGDSEQEDPEVPDDIRRYARFQKVDRAEYERVNSFLRDRTYITAREWAIARLCADFRTETGVEMTKIGDHLPDLVPFMTEPYSPQAVNQARHAFAGKVRKSGATFLYGAMCDFFTAEELDDVLYEATEVARFLLEVEGVELDLDEELAAEERIATVMRKVGSASEALRHEGAECPSCGHTFEPEHTEKND